MFKMNEARKKSGRRFWSIVEDNHWEPRRERKPNTDISTK